jgi:hypothetical protein
MKLKHAVAIAALSIAMLTSANAGTADDMLLVTATKLVYYDYAKCGGTWTRTEQDTGEWVIKMFGQGKLVKLMLEIKDRADEMGHAKFCSTMKPLLWGNG